MGNSTVLRRIIVVALLNAVSISSVRGEQILEVQDIAKALEVYSNTLLDNGGYTTSETSKFGSVISTYLVRVNTSKDLVLRESRRVNGESHFTNTVASLAPNYCFELSSKGELPWRFVRYALSDDRTLKMRDMGMGFDYSRPSQNQQSVTVEPYLTGIGGVGFGLLNAIRTNQLTDISSQKIGERIVEISATRKLQAYHYLPNGESLGGKNSHLVVRFELNEHCLPVYLREEIGRYRTESKATYSGQGFQVLKQIESIVETFEGSNSEKSRSFEIDSRPPTVQEFLLSYYGFPEPAELKQRQLKKLAIVGLACTAMTMFGIAAWLKRRRV